MPRSHKWRTFAEWGKKWGDIVHVTLVGQPIVILNSCEIAVDILEKKSSVYSDRPTLVVGGEMVGWNRALALLQNGPLFREQRRLFSGIIGNRSKVAQLAHLLETKTCYFLLRVLREPHDLSENVRMSTAATVLEISHGYQVEGNEDPVVRTIETAVEEFSAVTAPGAFLADVLPFLRHVPEWVPGAGWKKDVKVWAQHLRDMDDVPFRFVKEQMAAGTALPSLVSKHLAEDLSPEQEEAVKLAASSFYGGGGDTTVSLTRTFFLAMTRYLDIQKRAQSEINGVIGGERLPGLADREQLPYINALCLELFRWNPIVPLALAHRSSEEDIHAGYFIPKGTLVFPNIWKFLHDPQDYADPHEFKPERFLSSAGKAPERDPREFAFGFGRRICPGRHLADAVIFVTCAMTLAVFDICKPVEDGVEVEPEVQYTSGTIIHPLPFRWSIRSRSEKAIELIRSANSDS